MKPGDRVRLSRELGMVAKVGATGIVGPKGLFDHDRYVDIVWDRNSLSGEQNDGGYYSSHFEIIGEEKVDYMKITREMAGR